MAVTEDVVILRVDTGEAVKSVGDLRENIRQYKQIIKDAEIGSQEYKDALKGLTESQNALKGAMYATDASLENVTQAAKGLGTSYNALVNQMAELKKQWRATNDEAERNRLAPQIKEINDKLKGMDEQTGSFKRNVGNYTNSIVDAFGKMGGGVKDVINPIKNATAALDVMGKTPVIAILGLLASVLTKVISALNSSEEATQALNKALAPLRVLGDAATRTLQALGDIVVKVAEKFGQLTQAIFGTNEATKERIELAEMENRLANQSRETTMRNAEAERDAAELRAKAADKANYTAKERLEYLKQAGDLEKQISERAYQDAKLQYEIIKEKNSLTKSSKQDKDAEAQAYAAMVKAETSYYEKVRSINSGIARAMKEDATSAAKAVKAMKEAYTAPDFDAVLEEDDAEAQLAAAEKAEAEARARLDAELKVIREGLEAKTRLKEQEIADQKALDEEYARWKAQKDEEEKKRAEEMRKAWSTAVSATASILGSLADVFENTNKADVKAQQKAKNLRIASATIQMIQGAIGAYMQSVASIPPPAGIITGVAQAATVTAAGLANIAKMRSTSLESGSTSTSTPSFSSSTTSVGASLAAQPVTSPTTMATLATDTQMLNSLGSQRVYILASDLEAEQNGRRVRVAETTF